MTLHMGATEDAARLAAAGARRSPQTGHSSLFVSFEGVDGSGKSTQARLLEEHLAARGRAVVATREPGGTELGERIRRLLLDGPPISPWAEAALFAASRAEHAAQVIRPALERGTDVVSDRFIDSSLAYQGIARGLGLERVLELNLAVLDGLLPDRTFVLAVDTAEAAARREGVPDRIEQEGDAFQAEVARAYAELAERYPERVELLDGTLPPEEVAAAVRSRIEDLL
jgi:dTMP kinase